MLKWHNKGFVLADSIVALTILSILIAWYCVNERQLQSQMRHANQEVMLTRIAKEATDQFMIDHQKRKFNQKGYQVMVSEQAVQIKQNEQLMFTVTKQ